MNDLEAFERVTSGPWVTVGDDLQFRFEKGPINRLFFQCSDGLRDWINNFSFPAVAYKDSPRPWMAHGGFLRAWKSGKNIILPMILDCDRLEIFGYSHGGPLALFAHEAFYFHKARYADTRTFGSPRLIWDMNKPYISPRFVGVRNIQVRGDLVTCLPPKIMKYSHVGEVVRIGPKALFPSPFKHTPDSYRKALLKEPYRVGMWV